MALRVRDVLSRATRGVSRCGTKYRPFQVKTLRTRRRTVVPRIHVRIPKGLQRSPRVSGNPLASRMPHTRKEPLMAKRTPATATTVGFTTIQPLVRFTRSDGSVKAESSRSLRLYDGKLCVKVRSRLMPVERESDRVAIVRLNAKPLADGVADAQAVAPVVTLAKLGVPDAETRAKAAKPVAKKPTASAPAQDPTSAAVAALAGMDDAALAAFFKLVMDARK